MSRGKWKVSLDFIYQLDTDLKYLLLDNPKYFERFMKIFLKDLSHDKMLEIQRLVNEEFSKRKKCNEKNC